MPSMRVPKIALALLSCVTFSASAAPGACQADSGARVTPVVELYTSEGCSSCPPADRWLSALQPRDRSGASVVVQAFHVGYWDYIGWIDRFANPSHTARQRRIAQWNNQRSIYTPQAVLNGRDWRDWPATGQSVPAATEPARVALSLKKIGEERFEATVTTLPGAPGAWSAYWTVTESGHSSKVKAGENAGEFLKHDHVVRQYTEAGTFDSHPDKTLKLTLRAVAAQPGHARRINLVVFDPRSGRTLQAVSADCTV
jgi:hypothetical protein